MPDNPPHRSFLERLAGCFVDGARRGFRTALVLLAFMVPISFGVVLLKWTGALGVVAQWIGPAFGLVGLPGEAAVAFLTGALLNVYSGIAAMEPMGLGGREITLLALMILISHNLPIESTVLHKAGSSGLRMLILRLASSFVAAAALNQVLPGEPASGATAAEVARAAFGAALGDWAMSALWLVGKIILFVLGVMVLQRILDEFKIMPILARALKWPLALLGLPPRTIFLWLVANTLGLAYGAAVIIEEARLGVLTKEETGAVNCSVAVCHSLLEDTLLFVAVGAWTFWIVAPRLLLAALVTWAYRLWVRSVPPARTSAPPA